MLNLFKAVSNFVNRVIKAVAPKPATSKPGAASKPAASPAMSTRPSGFTSSQSSSAAKSGSASSGRSSGRASGRSSTSSNKQKLLSITPVDTELQVALSGSRLGEGVLRRIQHEGKPPYVSNKDYLKAHARTGWNKQDTEQIHRILVKSDARSENGFSSDRNLGAINPTTQTDGIETLEYYANLLERYRELSDQQGGELDEIIAALSAEGATEVYQAAIKEIFGITIDDNGINALAGESLPANPIEALMVLDKYRQGADTFAGWLAEQTGASLDERYEVFRRIMGPITLARVSEKPPGVSEDSKGFTADHIIYDRFDVFAEEMQSDLIIHEMVHAFVNSSGFGDYRKSPFNDQVLVGWMVEVFKDFAGADRGSPTSGDEMRGGDPEIIANFLQNLVTGAVQLTPEQRAFLQPILNDAIAVNELRHAPIEQVAAALGSDISTTYTNMQFSGGIFVRYEPESTTLPRGLALGETMVVLGQKTVVGKRWFYVGIDRGGYSDYGWVSEDGPGQGSIDTEGLPEITTQDTNPFNRVR